MPEAASDNAAEHNLRDVGDFMQRVINCMKMNQNLQKPHVAKLKRRMAVQNYVLNRLMGNGAHHP
jgi:hypothetical protein